MFNRPSATYRIVFHTFNILKLKKIKLNLIHVMFRSHMTILMCYSPLKKYVQIWLNMLGVKVQNYINICCKVKSKKSSALYILCTVCHICSKCFKIYLKCDLYKHF
jgi:hypothetical protein